MTSPFILTKIYQGLTAKNQLLKRKLKLGTSEIPIPPKRDDVTAIEAINRFNRDNPRVDTTNIQPVVKQSNVGEPNEGVIQGAFDTATMQARDGGYPPPIYETFKKRYLKRNMKADGGRAGYEDGGMLVQPSDDGSRPGYNGENYNKDKTVLDADTIKKIKQKIKLKPGQKWNFYDPEGIHGKPNPGGHTYGIKKSDNVNLYDKARSIGKPGRAETKLKQATEKYQEIKANPKLLAEKKLTDKERYQTNRTQILEDRNFKYETDKDYRKKKLEWAKQDRIKNPEKYKKKLNDYFAKKGRFPPGNNYKENVWRDMFRSSQKAGQERFLLVTEDGRLLTQDKFPMKDGKVRWDIDGAYKKVKFYDTKTKQFVKFDNTTKGKGIGFEKYLNQKSVGGKGAYENAINGYKNKDNIKDLTFKNSKGKNIRLGTIVQSKLNDGVNFINSGVNVQHPDLNNAFWKNEVSLASSNNELNYLETTLERKLKNAGNDINLRNKALNEFRTKINNLEGGITKIIDGETFGVLPTEKSVVQAIGKESRLGNFKEFKTLVASLGGGTCSVFSGKKVDLKADGGRIGLQAGTPNLDDCFKSGSAVINSGKVPVDKADDFAKLLKRASSIGRGIMKFGIIPEALFATADSLVRMGMGNTFKEAGLLATDYLLPGDQAKASEISKVKRFFGDTTGELVGRVIDYKNQLVKIQSLEDQKANLDNLSDGGEFSYIGDLTNDSNNVEKQLIQARNDLDNKFKISEAEQLFAESKQDDAYDASAATSALSNLKRKYRDSSDDLDDTEQLAAPEKTQMQLNLDILPQVPRDFMMATDDELRNYVNAESVRSGEKLDPQLYIDEKKKLKKEFMTKGPGVYGKEQVYGTQGIFGGEPVDMTNYQPNSNRFGSQQRPVLYPQGRNSLGLASGGIASLTKTIPPESGPTPHGLPYVYNNVKKI